MARFNYNQLGLGNLLLVDLQEHHGGSNHLELLRILLQQEGQQLLIKGLIHVEFSLGHVPGSIAALAGITLRGKTYEEHFIISITSPFIFRNIKYTEKRKLNQLKDRNQFKLQL